MFDVYDPSLKGNEAAEQLDVSVRTCGAGTLYGLASLRRTVRETRYRHDTLRASHTGADELAGETVCCARVSQDNQAEQLET